METAAEIEFHNSVRKIHQKGYTDEDDDNLVAVYNQFISQFNDI